MAYTLSNIADLDYYNHKIERSTSPKYMWDQMQSMVAGHLETMKVQRAVYDYVVVCDGSNNLPEHADQSTCIVDLYLNMPPLGSWQTVSITVPLPGWNNIIDYLAITRDVVMNINNKTDLE